MELACPEYNDRELASFVKQRWSVEEWVSMIGHRAAPCGMVERILKVEEVNSSICVCKMRSKEHHAFARR
jgi:hypothetical protein